jgi:uncharacterized protein HemX
MAKHIDKEELMKSKKEGLINLLYKRDDDVERLLQYYNKEKEKVENLRKEVERLNDQLKSICSSREYKLITALKTYMSNFATKIEVKEVDAKIDKTMEEHCENYIHEDVIRDCDIY